MSFNPAILDLISGAGSAPTPEVPTTISGLAMWFKADVMDTVNDLDLSGNVITWRDQSGNGRDVTQDTEASRPAWIAGSASGNINGLPVVHFNTGTKVLSRDNDNALRNKDGWTMIAVYRHDTVSFTPPIIAFSTGSSVTSYRAQIGHQSATTPRTAWRREDGNAITLLSGNTQSSGVVYQHVGRLDFRVGTASSMIRINGVQNDGSAPTTGTISDTDSLVFVVGRFSTFQWFGHLGEAMAYDRALSDAEVIQIETYLTARWGV